MHNVVSHNQLKQIPETTLAPIILRTSERYTYGPIPTNRVALLNSVRRYGEITKWNEGHDANLKIIIESSCDARMDAVLDLKVLPDLVRDLAGQNLSDALDFFVTLVDANCWISTLSIILGEFGWTRHAACMKWGINPVILHAWLERQTSPNVGSLGTISKIANFHGLPVEVLLSKIPRFVRGKVAAARKTTKHGVRQSELAKKEYLLHDWPAGLQAQWELLFEHKTESDAADMHRNESWRIKPDGHSETAESTRTCLSRIFGFLILPSDAEDVQLRGRSFRIDDLTLGLLADWELLRAYFKFHEERAGEINRGQRLIIQTISSLIRPLTGFVWQSPRYGNHPYLIDKYGQDILERDNWQELCRKTHLKLKDRRNWLEQNDYYVEPCNLEKIKPVLGLQNPSECLFSLTECMEGDESKKRLSKRVQAVHKRNVLLHELLSHNPLRVSHIGVLTYHPDNSGQLYRSGNCYHIRLKASDFKAWSNSLSEDYDAPLPEALTSKIDEYLTVWRPLLADATTCNYVFRPNPDNRKGIPNEPMTDGAVSLVLKKISRYYLLDFTPGFSAHDYRHILATTLVKNAVDGVELASLLLHVSRQMIDNHYGHYRDSKMIGKIQALISSNRKTWSSVTAQEA